MKSADYSKDSTYKWHTGENLVMKSTNSHFTRVVETETCLVHKLLNNISSAAEVL
jgi:hypothetical protein